MTDETVITAGGVLKSFGGGKFGGYGVLKSTPKDPDRQNEFFWDGTDFELQDRGTVPVLWFHGLDPLFKGRKLSRAIPTLDSVGVYFETRLVATDERMEQLIDLGNRGGLAYSTGSASHLVEKKTMGNGTRRIDVWPIVEVSLCLQSQAVEPRAKVLPLKTIASDITPFAQMMDQRDRVAKAEARAREIHVDLIKRAHEQRMREFERSQHSDAISEEQAYYNALAQLAIDKFELVKAKA